jgi:hypothetical protein
LPELPPLEDARCPRCGGGFHCGANDPGPCACMGLKLTAELQAALRARYTGCLCLACLAALAAGAPLEAEAP